MGTRMLPYLCLVVLGASVALVPKIAFGRGDAVLGSRYVSARGGAMGDAFIPLADDGTALFYNPAGLAKMRKAHVEPLNLQVEANTDYVSTLNRNFYKVTSLSNYEPTLGSNGRKSPGVGASLFPNVAFRGFGAGLLVQNRLWANGENGNVHYKSLYQVIPTVGGALRLAHGIIRLGYSLQWVNQASGDRTVSSTNPGLSWKDGLYQGAAFSHNAGFAVTLPYQYLPDFNIVARNVGGAKYSNTGLVKVATNPAGAPTKEDMSLDSSISFHPRAGGGSVWNWVFEYRDMTNRSHIGIMGRIATGLELSIKDTLFFRGGWGSGYPNAGVGLKRAKSELNLTWMSEEIGTSYHDLREVRYIFQYQMRAF